uniref:Uncharacterized protein n=1 Tax=Setaria italica TaxID=4555 RepID=K3XZW8_SETIT
MANREITQPSQPGGPGFDLNAPPLSSLPPPSSTIAPRPPRPGLPQFLPLFALRAATTLPLHGLQIRPLFPALLPSRAAARSPRRAGAAGRRSVGGSRFLDLAGGPAFLVLRSPRLLVIRTACWMVMAVTSSGVMAP